MLATLGPVEELAYSTSLNLVARYGLASSNLARTTGKLEKWQTHTLLEYEKIHKRTVGRVG